MTHAAAATRTLRSPRRRPHGPAAGERAGAVSGAVGASALVIAMCILSSTPSLDSTPAAVRAHLGSHYPVTIAAASTIVVAALLLVPFLASLRTDTARRTDVAQWRRTVTLVAGAIGTAMLALTGAPPLAPRHSGLRRPVIRGSAGQGFLVSGECVLADRADSSPSSGLFQRGPAGRPPRRCRLWPHR